MRPAWRALAAASLLALAVATPALAQEAPGTEPAATSTAFELEDPPRYIDPGSAQLEAAGDREDPSVTPPDLEATSYIAQLFRMLLVLGAICVLAYLVLGKLLPRLLRMSTAGRRGMIAAAPRGLVEVVDRLPLDPRRSLLIVRAGRGYFLVALSDQGMTLLSRLDDPSLDQVEPHPSEEGSFLGRFGGMLKQRMDKET